MAKTKSDTVVVCDAGPVIHLDEVGCLQLLADFKRVIVPDVVQREIRNHRDVSFEESDIAWSLVKPIFPWQIAGKLVFFTHGAPRGRNL